MCIAKMKKKYLFFHYPLVLKKKLCPKQDGQFRTVSVGMARIFHTGPTETPFNHIAPNFGQYRMVPDILRGISGVRAENRKLAGERIRRKNQQKKKLCPKSNCVFHIPSNQHKSV